MSRTSERLYPTGPTGNGFCMYIKRRALDEVGFFDAESFPRGYGEEGDFCMRARAAAWTNVVDDATIVFHHRSASFGGEKDELMRGGAERSSTNVIPTTPQRCAPSCGRDELEKVQRIVRGGLRRVVGVAASDPPADPLRSSSRNGRHARDQCRPHGRVARGLRAVPPDLRHEGPRAFSVRERWNRAARAMGLCRIASVRTSSATRATAQPSPDILTRYGIDLVHIRLLLAHTLRSAVRCPRPRHSGVLSFHDFFLVCPTVHLLDDADRVLRRCLHPGRRRRAAFRRTG